MKNVKVAERANFQLRAEAYNLFNHTNLDTVNTVLGGTNFGQIAPTGDPRSMQLGAKFTF